MSITYELSRTINVAHSSSVNALTMSADGRYAAGGVDNLLVIFSTVNAKELMRAQSEAIITALEWCYHHESQFIVYGDRNGDIYAHTHIPSNLKVCLCCHRTNIRSTCG